MLLEIVRKREMAYQVQDLICKTCHKAKTDDMSEYCDCSGEYVTKISKQSFLNSINAFLNISNYFNFTFLNQTVSWILEMNL